MRMALTASRRTMLRPPLRAQANVRSASLPAPVEGWDTSSPQADMPPKRAILLDNFFPRAEYIELRKGHTEHADGIGSGDVESLMVWNGPSSSKMFAGGNNGIYDVSSSGSVGAADVGSLTNDRHQSVNFTTSGGHFLVAVNGADAVNNYNGSSWSQPSITGFASETSIYVHTHKSRLWFLPVNSTKAYYLPVNSIAGAANYIELGAVWRLGGYAVAMGSWTIDGGAGPDDLAVFISSRGEVALYQGTDPDYAATWQLIGTFEVPPPVGLRPFTKVGTDIAVTTQAGIIPFSQSLVTERGAAERIAITARIREAIRDAYALYGTRFGWQFERYPAGNAAWLNVPVSTTTSHQYVMNVLTGAWCRYTGQPAACMAVYGDNIYFGGKGSGKVFKADTGRNDDGSNITGDVQGAFTYLGAKGQLKRFTMMRPIASSSGIPTPAVEVFTDFRTGTPIAVPTSAEVGTTAQWGVSGKGWGQGTWGSDNRTSALWTSVTGLGYCVSPRVQMKTSAMSYRITAFDLMFEPGGYL